MASYNKYTVYSVEHHKQIKNIAQCRTDFCVCWILPDDSYCNEDGDRSNVWEKCLPTTLWPGIAVGRVCVCVFVSLRVSSLDQTFLC